MTIRNKFSKVSFYNKDLWKHYLGFISILSAIGTLVSIFFDVPDTYKVRSAGVFVLVLFGIFIWMWHKANSLEKVFFRINQTKVNIIVGDILNVKADELNIIGFNEYFDTQVDNRIIAENTLHGRFLKKHSDWIGEIDKKVTSDLILSKYKRGTNTNRIAGKREYYELGSVLEINQYVLTAFSKFDEDNRAYLFADDYLTFWMNFWKNIDEIYSGRTINIPLMGAGITRFRDGKPTKQELLETMLWTLKISGFYCTYGIKSVNFIIYEGDKDEINFYHIQHGLSFK